MENNYRIALHVHCIFIFIARERKGERRDNDYTFRWQKECARAEQTIDLYVSIEN